MKKNKYFIYHVSVIVERYNNVKDFDTFSFLIRNTLEPITRRNIYVEMQKQFEYYNEFCPLEYKITNYEHDSLHIEKVGEIWL